MEITKKSIVAESPAASLVTAALVNGNIELPDPTESIRDILYAPVYIREVEATTADGCVHVNGMAEFIVLYMNEDQILKSVSAQTDFSQTIAAPLVLENMHAAVICNAPPASASATGPNSIKVESFLEFEIQVWDTVELEYIASVTEENIQTLQEDISASWMSGNWLSTLTIRDDMELPEGYPDIAEVLLPEGTLQVTSVLPGQDLLDLEGMFHLSILYRTSDPQRPVQEARFQIPFEAQLDTQGISSGMRLFVQARPVDLLIQIREDVEERQRIVSVEAPACLQVEGWETSGGEMVTDAYGLKRSIDPQYTRISMVSTPIIATQEMIYSGSIQMAHPLPAGAHVLYVHACPLINSISPGESGAHVEGKIHVFLLFQQPEMGLQSVTGEADFSRDLSWESGDPDAQISLFIENTRASVVRSGEGVDIQAQFQVVSRSTQTSMQQFMQEIQENAEAEILRDAPISLIVAEKNDTSWSIAKQCRVSVKSLLQCNPDIKDGIRQGDRILIVR